jgi:hypothetical protein
MNFQIQGIIDSFESTSKSKGARYDDLLAHVYMTFDKQISLAKTDREMNKYKKMRNNILSYIVANERAIKSEICK